MIALEDALSKGLPVQAELNTLYSSLEGTGSTANSDSLLNVVFSSLPKDTLERGVDTPLQLNQKVSCLFMCLLRRNMDVQIYLFP